MSLRATRDPSDGLKQQKDASAQDYRTLDPRLAVSSENNPAAYPDNELHTPEAHLAPLIITYTEVENTQGNGLETSDSIDPPLNHAQDNADDTSSIVRQVSRVIQNLPPPLRPRTIRFRSRVRIASGIANSGDSSASSSISVPLRNHSEQPCRLTPRIGQKLLRNDIQPATEADSLLSPYATTYGTVDDIECLADGCYPTAESDIDRPRSEEDIIYGRWPWRMVSLKWWIYSINHSCCCGEESDDEG